MTGNDSTTEKKPLESQGGDGVRMIFRFDDFELDSARFELRHGGTARHIEPLVFDLILFFARNPGRVIGRDEIIDQVWSGRVVSDATVSSCVKSARKALGDDGNRQGYLETVRGRGFRFTADVLAADRDAAANSDVDGADGAPANAPANALENPPVADDRPGIASSPWSSSTSVILFPPPNMDVPPADRDVISTRTISTGKSELVSFARRSGSRSSRITTSSRNARVLYPKSLSAPSTYRTSGFDAPMAPPE